MTKTCSRCRYWTKLEPQDPTHNIGACHRFPPLPAAEDQYRDLPDPFAVWVQTLADDWCGEFQPGGSGA